MEFDFTDKNRLHMQTKHTNVFSLFRNSIAKVN